MNDAYDDGLGAVRGCLSAFLVMVGILAAIGGFFLVRAAL